jgi:hypothetical protein
MIPLAQFFYERVNWPFHVLFMAFFLGLGAFLLLRMRREAKGWEMISSRLGLIFQEKAGERMKPMLAAFDLFRGGNISQATQILNGTYQGSDIYAFNWFFRADLSLTAVRGGFACVIVTLPQKLKPIRLFPETFDSFLSSLGPDRVVLGPDDFAARYRIQCRGRGLADTVFHEEMIAKLMAEPELMLSIESDLMLIARVGELMPANVQQEIDRAIAIANLIPEKISV